MDDQVTTVVVEGDIQPPVNHWLIAGSDLDFALAALRQADPIDADSEHITPTMWAVRKALDDVRAQILRRKAVLAGPRDDVEYCGVSDKHGRACGPELGLPPCKWHARVGVPGQPDPGEKAMQDFLEWASVDPQPAPEPEPPALPAPAVETAPPADPAEMAANAVEQAANEGYTGSKLRFRAMSLYIGAARCTVREAVRMVDPAIAAHEN